LPQINKPGNQDNWRHGCRVHLVHGIPCAHAASCLYSGTDFVIFDPGSAPGSLPRIDLRQFLRQLCSELQLDIIKGLNCRYGQGFLFSPALPAPDLESLLLEWQYGKISRL
jgi:hypothetical protein